MSTRLTCTSVRLTDRILPRTESLVSPGWLCGFQLPITGSLQSVGQTICHYVPVLSDSLICFYYYIHTPPTSVLFGWCYLCYYEHYDCSNLHRCLSVQCDRCVWSELQSFPDDLQIKTNTRAQQQFGQNNLLWFRKIVSWKQSAWSR